MAAKAAVAAATVAIAEAALATAAAVEDVAMVVAVATDLDTRCSNRRKCQRKGTRSRCTDRRRSWRRSSAGDATSSPARPLAQG